MFWTRKIVTKGDRKHKKESFSSKMDDYVVSVCILLCQTYLYCTIIAAYWQCMRVILYDHSSRRASALYEHPEFF